MARTAMQSKNLVKLPEVLNAINMDSIVTRTPVKNFVGLAIRQSTFT